MFFGYYRIWIQDFIYGAKLEISFLDIDFFVFNIFLPNNNSESFSFADRYGNQTADFQIFGGTKIAQSLRQGEGDFGYRNDIDESHIYIIHH